ncbi:PQQ-binding-like beta-propeller repeat protein [Acidianus sulfidivorans JP7]|uniref:Pyrrolo-quinoline quinone n=1 Tax=Acidianus sulfidivorans JP7 TaxID=619593 RepID=A0A2U9IJF9_9CREN|nr:PQQ-binding-like beta-propeller repeat protein [Acidianus sulfidivorans]AWR96162.1 PQQ-binding-like beta-propeller repeat protein [Acidianus sulfidivorans JP7]
MNLKLSKYYRGIVIFSILMFLLTLVSSTQISFMSPTQNSLLSNTETNNPSNAVTNWSQFQGSATHDGYSAWNGPINSVVVWNEQLGGENDGLLEYDHILIVNYLQRGIFSPSDRALNETNGNQIYDLYTYCPIYPAAGEGMIYLPRYYELCAYNISNGNEVWSSSTSINPTSAMISYSNGYVYLTSYDSDTICSFLASTGTKEWTVELNGGITTIPTIGDGLVVVGLSNQIVAISTSSGEVEWNFSFDGSISDTPSYYDGMFFFGTSTGNLYAVNSEGGLVWEKNFGSTIFTTPAIANNLLYFSVNNILYAVNYQNGNIVWNFFTNGNITASPVVSANGIVYTGTSDGILYAINATNGELIWQYSIGDTIVNLLLDNGFLFVMTYDGTLYAFGSEYSITFTESGLPAGTTWSVTLTGEYNKTTISSSSSTITFNNLPEGIYSFTISPSILYEGIGAREVVSQSSGSITLTSNSTVQITYLTQYYLLVNSTYGGTVSPSSGWYNAGSEVQLCASAYFGYQFIKWIGSGIGSYSGKENNVTITINGPINETAIFLPVYVLTFSESGLPSGTTWSVTVNGTTKSITIGFFSDCISFNLPEGIYYYNVSIIYGNNDVRYVPSTFSGIVSLSEGEGVNINYVTQYYVSINSTPGGTVSPSSGWYDQGTTLQISAKPSYGYQFVEWNGSGYDAYTGYNNESTIEVCGPINETAYFERVYTLVFIEGGLPSGTTWCISLNGTTKSSTSPIITFNNLPAGIYSFYISSSVNNYSAEPKSNIIVVKGSSYEIKIPVLFMQITPSNTLTSSNTVTYTSPHTTTTSTVTTSKPTTSLNNLLPYIIIIAVVVVAIIGVVLAIIFGLKK